MKNFENNQNGRSMIEMLGVLAIIGVLSVGGIAGYSKAMHKYRVNKAIEQITLIAGNIRSFFASQRNYKELYCSSSMERVGGNCASFTNGVCSYGGCPILKKAKIFPDEMITVNDQGQITSIVNPFGNGVGLNTAGKAKENDYQAFIIQYNLGDNTEACIDLLANDWIDAGAKAVKINLYRNEYKAKIPVPMDVVITQCSSIVRPTADRDAYITFYFDIDTNSDIYSSFH